MSRVSTLCNSMLIATFFLMLLSGTAQAVSTPIRLDVVTGSDDLRDGNKAFVSLNLTDGTSTREQVFATNLGQNSRFSRVVTFETPAGIPLSRIRSVTIRHDGSPRSGHPFDSYDNWDLQRLSVTLLDRSGNTIGNIYNSINDTNPERRIFLFRFTGDQRQLTVLKQR